jgi:hypothetical protein
MLCCMGADADMLQMPARVAASEEGTNRNRGGRRRRRRTRLKEKRGLLDDDGLGWSKLFCPRHHPPARPTCTGSSQLRPCASALSANESRQAEGRGGI